MEKGLVFKMENSQSLWQLAFTYFLVINPLGNSPLILSILKDYDFHEQRKIVLREGFFAFIIALVFQFFGEHFLGTIGVEAPALSFCGGIILFLLSLMMIFPHKDEGEKKRVKQQPFIVPIAIPLLVGPGSLSVIMLTAAAEDSVIKVTAAITIACAGMIAIVASAPYLQRLIGKVGMAVVEQVMGMMLTLMAVEMILKGAAAFINGL